MEQLSDIKIENKEKLINTLEIVLFDEGSPRERVDIVIDGKSDSSFFFGVGKFIKAVPLEQLQTIFPYLVDSIPEGKFKINTRNLKQMVEDIDGLKTLSNYLGIPISVVKRSKGKIIDQGTIT